MYTNKQNKQGLNKTAFTRVEVRCGHWAVVWQFSLLRDRALAMLLPNHHPAPFCFLWSPQCQTTHQKKSLVVEQRPVRRGPSDTGCSSISGLVYVNRRRGRGNVLPGEWGTPSSPGVPSKLGLSLTRHLEDAGWTVLIAGPLDSQGAVASPQQAQGPREIG